jgi:MFS family permease
MNVLRKPYYGWWIVGELAITQTITWGIVYYAFSVFITSIEAELGWSRGLISGAFSLAYLISGLMAVPVGFWIDRFGARLLMTVAVSVASLLMIRWSQVQTVFAFYAVWIALGVCMSAILYEPAFAVIAKWFNRRRGLALAIVTFAAGFASTIFLPLANWLLLRSNWREATFTLGILLAVTVIPFHAVILRRHPHDLGLQPDGVALSVAEANSKQDEDVSLVEALRQSAFWWFTIAFACGGFAAFTIRFHMIPLLLDRGFDATFAASVTGVIGAMQVAGRLLYVPTETQIPKRLMIAGIFSLQTIAFLILILFQTAGGVWVFVVMLGAANGAMTLARPALLADFFGTKYYGRISSVVVLCVIIVVTLGPVSAGWMYTIQGHYNTMLWIFVGLSALAVVAISFVRKNE